MAVTLNAKGTSVSTFMVGKDGPTLNQNSSITVPTATDFTFNLDTDQSVIIDAGTSGPALITSTNNHDLHINPATGGGQYLILNSSRWPTTTGTTGQALTTNGSGILSWTTIAGTGTVTSVAITPSDGIGVTGGPITSSGTFNLSLGDITPDSVAAVGTVTGSNLSGTHAGTSSGTNTGDQTITLTGDVTGSGTGSFAATLATIGTAVSDSFVKITTDAKGRTYATSAVTLSDITTVLGYTPLNKAGDTMSGALVLNANPSTALGAATKQYVDSEIAAVVSGINVHAACETATSAALAASTYNNGTAGVGATLTCNTNSALGTIGGYAGLNTSSRILVKNQSATLQNGIYTVTSLGVDGVLPWILTRATDFDGSPTSEVQAGDMTFVQEGTFAGTQWVQIAVGTGSPGDYIIVGTNPIVFSQFAGSGTYTAGTGINITDAVISNTGVTSAVAGANISVSAATGAVTFAVTGTVPTATTATTLATGRTFSLSTDATGTSGSFDGSGNVTIPMTLATVNASPQTDALRKVTVNAKGLVTATSAVTAGDITALVDSTYVNISGDTMTGGLQIGTNMASYGNLNVARNTGNPYATITLGDELTPTNTVGIYLRQTSGNAGISTGGSALSFYRGGPGTTETMSLGPNGNVTINAPSSGFGLAVQGGGLSVTGSIVTASGNANWGTIGSSSVAGSFWQFYKGGTSTQIGYIGSDGGGAVSGGVGDNFAIRAEGALYLNSGATSRVVIGSAGNVTIASPSSGTTLSVTAPASGFSAEFIHTTQTGILLRNTSSTSGPNLRLYNDQNSSVRALELNYTGSAYAQGVLTGATAGEAGSIATTGNYPLYIGTNNTSRMAVETNGNITIGTTSQTGPTLKINSTSGSRPTLNFSQDGTSKWNTALKGDAAQNYYLISNPAETVGVYMTPSASGWNNLSDERYKENWEELSNATTKVKTLRAGTFSWKEDTSLPRDVGLIAQDVLAILPEAVDNSDPDRLGLRLASLVPLLVKALQEQQTVIEDLSARLIALEYS